MSNSYLKQEVYNIVYNALKTVCFFEIDSVSFDKKDPELAYFDYVTNEDENTVEIEEMDCTKWCAENASNDIIIPATLGNYDVILDVEK